MPFVLIDDLGIWLERAETVGEALRNYDLGPFDGTKFDAHGSPESWRALADVHCDVEDAAPSNTNELVLRQRRYLKMEAANGGSPCSSASA